MKKTLALILIGIVAVTVLGYGAISLFRKSDPTIEVAEPTDAALENKYTFVGGSDTSESQYSAAASETVPEETTEKEGFFSSLFEKTTKAAAGETTSVKSGTTSPVPTSAGKTTVPAKTTAKAVSGGAIEDYKYAYAGFNPRYANTSVPVERILVNRDYILPDNYSVKLEPAVKSDPDGAKLDYRVAPHYNDMYKAALKDGVELTPVSGYRSIERQTNNFEKKIKTYMDQGMNKKEATIEASTIILPPGTSEHNAGLAMDICSLYESFEKTDEFKWLDKHAADYGFILRYPKDKVDITKIIYEPWHWRYVGVDAAKKMKASGQCFEEYMGVA